MAALQSHRAVACPERVGPGHVQCAAEPVARPRLAGAHPISYRVSFRSENQAMRSWFASHARLRAHVLTWAVAFVALASVVPCIHAQGRAECSVIHSQILARS